MQDKIPLWIGADKSRMLKIAARFADVVNLNTFQEGVLTRSNELEQYEKEEKRKIERSLFTRVVISKTNEKALAIFNNLIDGELKQAMMKRDKSSILKKWIVGDNETCTQRILQFKEAGTQSIELGFVFEDLPDLETISIC